MEENLLLRSLIPFMMAWPLWSNYLPEAPSPNIFTLGIDFNIWLLGEHKCSVYNTQLIWCKVLLAISQQFRSNLALPHHFYHYFINLCHQLLLSELLQSAPLFPFLSFYNWFSTQQFWLSFLKYKSEHVIPLFKSH